MRAHASNVTQHKIINLQEESTVDELDSRNFTDRELRHRIIVYDHLHAERTSPIYYISQTIPQKIKLNLKILIIKDIPQQHTSSSCKGALDDLYGQYDVKN